MNFNELRKNLTEQDTDQIVQVIASRCMKGTRQRLKGIIAFNTKGIPHYGIFNRLMKDDRGWYYVPGKDEVNELKLIRNIITRGK